ncbi:DUF7344 domain-containing protein [Halostella salina]|uniref:DUF7344 domain-containing protein n=1 Tax=Halostella salina TaxID=1547897 RepID=UPI0013CF12EE|nr:ArsR family transcriptional regulator [Halostella salina]
MSDAQRDAHLDLMADESRRKTVNFLHHEATGPVSLEELVDNVHKPPPGTGDAKDRESVAVELHHIHLPRLAEHDIVAYDPESRLVSYQPDEQAAASLGSLLDTVASDD